MIPISNADFSTVIGIFSTIEQCRGTTLAEENAFRQAKRLRKKFQRKKQQVYGKDQINQACLF